MKKFLILIVLVSMICTFTGCYVTLRPVVQEATVSDAYEEYEDATMIYPGGSELNKGGYGSHKPWFDYNEEDGLYYRYQFNQEHIDEMNGEQVAVSNVIFKICHGEVRDQNDYLAFGVHGEGKAVIFTNGKAIEGTWKRTSDSAANMFYDEDGNEIVFNQGKTWICNIWEEYAEYAEWK